MTFFVKGAIPYFLTKPPCIDNMYICCSGDPRYIPLQHISILKRLVEIIESKYQ